MTAGKVNSHEALYLKKYGQLLWAESESGRGISGALLKTDKNGSIAVLNNFKKVY